MRSAQHFCSGTSCGNPTEPPHRQQEVTSLFDILKKSGNRCVIDLLLIYLDILVLKELKGVSAQ